MAIEAKPRVSSNLKGDRTLLKTRLSLLAGRRGRHMATRRSSDMRPSVRH